MNWLWLLWIDGPATIDSFDPGGLTTFPTEWVNTLYAACTRHGTPMVPGAVRLRPLLQTQAVLDLLLLVLLLVHFPIARITSWTNTTSSSDRPNLSALITMLFCGSLSLNRRPAAIQSATISTLSSALIS